MYLRSEEPGNIREYLDTVVHEFRHAMQWQFIKDGTYNHAGDDYRRRMAVNMRVYAEKPPELYNKQLCERDAVMFADMVLQWLEGGNKDGGES